MGVGAVAPNYSLSSSISGLSEAEKGAIVLLRCVPIGMPQLLAARCSGPRALGRVGWLSGVAVTAELCAFVESGLKKFGSELVFSSGADFLVHVAPHFRRKRNVPQGQLVANAPQPHKVPGIRPPPAFVRDPVKVDDTSRSQSRFKVGFLGKKLNVIQRGTPLRPQHCGF